MFRNASIEGQAPYWILLKNPLPSFPVLWLRALSDKPKLVAVIDLSLDHLTWLYVNSSSERQGQVHIALHHAFLAPYGLNFCQIFHGSSLSNRFKMSTNYDILPL